MKSETGNINDISLNPVKKEKSIIIARVSSSHQDEKQQIPECKEFNQNHGWDLKKVFHEKQSAWKTYVPRKELLKALEYARKKGVKHVIFWHIDRFWRNRKKAVEDIKSYSQAGIQLHFVQQAFLEDIWKAPHPWNEILYDMILNVLTWTAEEESRTRSERVKKAFKNGDHENWGRPKAPFTDEEIRVAVKTTGSYRQAREVLVYRDQNGNSKKMSLGAISRAIKRVKECSKKQASKLPDFDEQDLENSPVPKRRDC